MQMRHLAVDRVIPRLTLMVPMMSVPSAMAILGMAMAATFDHAREGVWCVLLMKRMLRAVHEPNVALIGQYEAQRHTKRDGDLQNPAVPRERQKASYRYCRAKA